MWELISGILGLVIGFFIAAKVKKSEYQDSIRLLKSQKKADQNTYLQVLLRNLSNILIARDLDDYCEMRRKTFNKVEEFKTYSPELRTNKISQISERYPYIKDFDKIDAKEFILPFDAVSTLGLDELHEVYEDIHVFLAADDHSNGMINEVVDYNRNFFEQYVQRIKDTKFKQKVLREIRAYLDTKVITDKVDLTYTLRNIEIREIDHFADRRYGLYFKDTNEYAIYEVFYDGSKAYESVYRSDNNFEVEEILDALNVDFIYERQIVKLT